MAGQNASYIIGRIKSEIPGMDVATALDFLDNNEDIYVQVVEVYIEEYIREDIDRALEASDIDLYRTRVHALKSSSRSIGAMELAKGAEELEMAAKASDLDLINAKHAKVMSEYSDLIEKLKDITV